MYISRSHDHVFDITQTVFMMLHQGEINFIKRHDILFNIANWLLNPPTSHRSPSLYWD